MSNADERRVQSSGNGSRGRSGHDLDRCGGGSGSGSKPKPQSDEQQIISVTEQFDTAFAAKDGKTVCGLLSPAGVAVIEADGAPAPPCERHVPEVANAAGGGLLQSLKFAAVRNVQVRGDTAQADVAVGGNVGTVQARYEKVAGTWKISKPPVS